MPLAVGQRLGDYVVEAPLGAGGMGEVYRARDTRLEREVALKLLPPAFAADPDRRARFEREAKLLAALNHPGIAHLYGFEEKDGQPFLALELAEGEDLHARIARGRLPAEEAVAVARQVAEALEAAHEKGIVHRDLKPANVVVAADGQVKVLDFGLAKAWSGDGAGPLSGDATHSPTLAHSGTQAGVLLGTAAYMAPEQARGKPVDKRADVWAFGVLLFEMLSGRRLFDGETITDVLAAVVRQEIDWSALPRETPARVLALLRRCLERDPKLRLRDIGEARIALAVAPEPAPSTGVAPAGVSRRRTVVLVASASGAALALGYGLGRRGAPAGGASAEALSVTRITSSGNVIGAAISPDGRLVAYAEAEQGEQSLWLRQLATGQTLRLVPNRTEAYWGHTFTPDGNSIVFGLKGSQDRDGAFYSISTLGGAQRKLASGIDSPPAFSPDGSRMAWVRSRHPAPDDSALMVSRSDGSDARALAVFRLPERVAPLFFTGPSWSPDGRRIACAVARVAAGMRDGGGKLVAVSVDDGRIETLIEPGWSSATQVAWLPDASGLLVVATEALGDPGQVWFVPQPHGSPRRVTTDLLDYRIVSLTADGRSLVTVGADALSSIFLGSTDGGARLRRLTSSRADGLFGIGFTGDGRLVYTSGDGGRDALWVTSLDGAERSPLASGDGLAHDPQLAPTGQVFFFARTSASAEIRSLSLDGGAPRVVATGAFDRGLAVSPDGRKLVYTAVREGELRLLHVATDGGTPELVSEDPAEMPAFSPDGKRLAFYARERSSNRYEIRVVSMDGLRTLQRVEAPIPNNNSRIVFRDEGLYVNTMANDRANLWLQPLDGRPARRITDFPDELLNAFAFSPDGKTLALARGPRRRDALLVRGFA